ncbi:MAG: hypothetical protein HY820_34660 [Acidobacteria bacterium]|nr:hypothetical protein [Acidobacteriota bacterium]
MCYVVYLSTSCADDLSVHNTELLRLRQEENPEAASGVLRYAHRWYVGSKAGCSCSFRHVTEAELGFGLPQDWMPEDAEDIAATAEFFRLARGLMESGHSVDCVDAWTGTAAVDIRHMGVELGRLPEGEFRFFENYHFEFA